MATYIFPSQKRPSRVLIRRDVTNPRAEIARQTGKEVLGFRWLDDEPEPTTTYPLVVEFSFCIDIGPPQSGAGLRFASKASVSPRCSL
jgi:hypothetical protein